MIKQSLLFSAASVLGAMALAIPAAAQTTNFSFVSGPIGGGFPTPFQGAFSLTGTGPSQTLTSFNAVYNGFQFGLGNVGTSSPTAGFLVIGGTLNGASTINAGTNDFFFAFNQNTFAASNFSIAAVGFAGVRSSTLSVTPVAQAVPEPTTWAMLIDGFGLIGGAMRRKRNVTMTVSFASS